MCAWRLYWTVFILQGTKKIIMKKNVILTFKIIVSITLICFLLVSINWDEALYNISKLDTVTLTLVLLLYAIVYPLSALKWSMALKIHKLDYEFLYLLKTICIGFFFNNFLPTSIGGDVYRVIRTIPKNAELKSRSLSAVVLERILGFVALLTLGFFGAVFIISNHDYITLRYYISIYITGTILFVLFVLLLKNIKFRQRISFIFTIKKLDALFQNLRYIIADHNNLVKLLLLSILFQVISVSIIYIMFSALGVEGVWAKSAYLSAIIGIVAILPISINGIGVVEGSFVVAAMLVGINQTDAAIVAILLRIFVIPLSTICGIVYAIDSKRSATV